MYHGFVAFFRPLILMGTGPLAVACQACRCSRRAVDDHLVASATALPVNGRRDHRAGDRRRPDAAASRARRYLYTSLGTISAVEPGTDSGGRAIVTFKCRHSERHRRRSARFPWRERRRGERNQDRDRPAALVRVNLLASPTLVRRPAARRSSPATVFDITRQSADSARR